MKKVVPRVSACSYVLARKSRCSAVYFRMSNQCERKYAYSKFTFTWPIFPNELSFKMKCVFLKTAFLFVERLVKTKISSLFYKVI